MYVYALDNAPIPPVAVPVLSNAERNAYRFLDDPQNPDSGRLLRVYSDGPESAATRITSTARVVANTPALLTLNENEAINFINRCTVFLSTYFTQQTGRLIANVLRSPANLAGSYVGANLRANATGGGDIKHQRTLGFVFFLCHFGQPRDLKHKTVYGRSTNSGNYKQRRWVMAATDTDFYSKGLVMVHDAVWPRHLFKGTLTDQIRVNYFGNAHPPVNLNAAGAAAMRDPHSLRGVEDYYWADLIRIGPGLALAAQYQVVPQNSIILARDLRNYVANEYIQFHRRLGNGNQDLLTDPRLLLNKLNEWIRPQGLMPSTVQPNQPYADLNALQNQYDLTRGVDSPSRRAAVFNLAMDNLSLLYKFNRGRVAGLIRQWPYAIPARSGGSGARHRTGAEHGFRAFGWPYPKYLRPRVPHFMDGFWTCLGYALPPAPRAAMGPQWMGYPEIAALTSVNPIELQMPGRPMTFYSYETHRNGIID